MNKSLLILFAVVALLLSMGSVRASGASEIRVDDDGVECPNPAAHTIQGGVDLAQPGDTVRVCAGTYAGGISIFKDGLKLKTKGAVRVVAAAGSDQNGILVQANQVEIREFELSGFVGPGRYAIAVFGSQGTIIKGNRVHDNTFSIFVNGASTLRVEGNDVHHNASGIVLANVNTSIVKDNSSHENVFGQGGEGIVLCGASSDNKVFDNTILRNGGVGILLSECDGVVAHGNRMEKNQMHDNGVLDARDDSQGSGTAGTANSWKKNDCATDSPNGLCP